MSEAVQFTGGDGFGNAPHDVVKAANTVVAWFEKNNIKLWTIGGVTSEARLKAVESLVSGKHLQINALNVELANLKAENRRIRAQSDKLRAENNKLHRLTASADRGTIQYRLDKITKHCAKISEALNGVVDE